MLWIIILMKKFSDFLDGCCGTYDKNGEYQVGPNEPGCVAVVLSIPGLILMIVAFLSM
jgi:hypothetical protein